MQIDRHRGTWGEVYGLGLFGRAWVLGIIGFSAARALIAWPTFDQYGVNPLLFLVLDLATAPPYGIGQAVTVKILRTPERTTREAVPWALLVAAMFLAPYVYIFAASGAMPTIVYVLVLVWMAVFATLAVLRMRRQVRGPVDEHEE